MRASKRRTQKKWEQKIAQERITQLFQLAAKAHKTQPTQSKRYVELARKISMRYRSKIPHELKKHMCKTCNNYLTPPDTVRIRLKNGYILHTCLNCGREKRYPYKNNKQNHTQTTHES